MEARSSILSKNFFALRNNKELWDNLTPDEQEYLTNQVKSLAQQDQKSEGVAGGFSVDPNTGALSSSPSDVQRMLEIEKAGVVKDPNKPGYTGAAIQGLRTGTGNVAAIAPEVLVPFAQMADPDTAAALQQMGKNVREGIGGEIDPNVPQELSATKLSTGIMAGDWDKVLSRETLGDLYNYGMGQVGNMAPSAALSMGAGAVAAKIAPRALAPLVAEGTAGRQVLEKAKTFTGASGKVLAGAAGSTLGAGVPMEISAIVSDATEAGKAVDPLSTLAAGTAAGLVEAPMNIMLGKRIGNVLAPEGEQVVARGLMDAGKQFIKEAPKTMLFEGAQEGVQRVIERAGGVGNKVYEDVIDPTDILENFAGGAIGGAGMSGVTTVGGGALRSAGRKLGLAETKLSHIAPDDWARAKKDEILGRMKGAKTQAQAQQMFDEFSAQAVQEAASDPDHVKAMQDLFQAHVAEMNNAIDTLPELDHSIKLEPSESEKAMEMYADPDLDDLGGTVRAHLEGLMTDDQIQKAKAALANTIRQLEMAANLQEQAAVGDSSQFLQEQMNQPQAGRMMPGNIAPMDLQDPNIPVGPVAPDSPPSPNVIDPNAAPPAPPAPPIAPEQQHILDKASRGEPLTPFEQQVAVSLMPPVAPAIPPAAPVVSPAAETPQVAPAPAPAALQEPAAPVQAPKFASQYDVEEEKMRSKGVAPERIEAMKRAGFNPTTEVGINDASQIGHHNTELARMEQFAEENKTNAATAKISISNLKGVNSVMGEDGANRLLGEVSQIIKDRLTQAIEKDYPGAFVNVWRTGGPNFSVNAVGDGLTGDVLNSIVANISKELKSLNDRTVATKEGNSIKLGEIKHPTVDIRGINATFGTSDISEVSPKTGKKMNLQERRELIDKRIAEQEAQQKDETEQQWSAANPDDSRSAVSSISAMAKQPDAGAGVHQRSSGARPDAGGNDAVSEIVPGGLAEGLGTAAGAVGRAYEAEGLTREEVELMGSGHAGAGVIQLDPSFGLVDGRNGWSTRILFNHLRSLAEENKRDYAFVMIDHKAVSSINALMNGNTEYANALIRLVMSRINARLIKETGTQEDVTGVRVGGDETGVFVKMSPEMSNIIMGDASEEIHAALIAMGLDKVPNFKHLNNRAMWGAGFYFHVVPITPTSTYQQVMDEAGKMIEVTKDKAKSRAQQALIDMQKKEEEKAKYPLGPPRKEGESVTPSRGGVVRQGIDQYGNAIGDPVFVKSEPPASDSPQKELWEMTKDEFEAAVKVTRSGKDMYVVHNGRRVLIPGTNSVKNALDRGRRYFVYRAMANGKQVPYGVLAELPGIAEEFLRDSEQNKAKTEVRPALTPEVKPMIDRQEEAKRKFIESAAEQFGFTEDQAKNILAEYMKLKVVKLNPNSGQFELQDGRLWAKDPMDRALAMHNEATPKQPAPQPGALIIKNLKGEVVDKIEDKKPEEPVKTPEAKKPADQMTPDEKLDEIERISAERVKAKQAERASLQKSKADLVNDILADVSSIMKTDRKGAIDLKTSQPIMRRIFKNIIELGYRTFQDAVKFLKSLMSQNPDVKKFLNDPDVQELAETMWDVYSEIDTNIEARGDTTLKSMMEEEQQNEPQSDAGIKAAEPVVGAQGAVSDGRRGESVAEPVRAPADEGAGIQQEAGGDGAGNIEPDRPNDAADGEPRSELGGRNEDSQGGMAFQPVGDIGESNGVSGEVPNTPVDDNRLEYAHAPGDSMLEKKIGPVQRFEANMRAINLLKKLTEENRLANAEEQKVLAEFSGWGPIPQAFFKDRFSSSYFSSLRYGISPADAFSRTWSYFQYEYNSETDRQWMEKRKQLLFSMTAEQYNAARASTINAHYTSPALYRAMWDGLRHLGFTGGNVLEPAIGSGIAISNMPADLRNASGITGVDMDATSAEISKHLFQKSNIIHAPFQEATLPDNFFNLIISNVPFADIAISHRGKPYNRFLLHDYFFARSLDLVRPGGMVAFITSKGTLDKIDPKVREYLSNDYRDSGGTMHPGFDLLTAIRYPRNAFKDIANTEVVTDLLVLRKRTEIGMTPKPIPSELVEVKTEQGPIQINRFYQDNPGNLLGTLDKKGTMYGSDSPSMAPIEGMDLSAKTAEILKSLDPVQQQAQSIEEVQQVSNAMPGVFRIEKGKIVVNKGGVDVNPDLSDAGKKIVTSFIPVRDTCTKLIALMTDPNSSDKDISDAQAQLKTEYDAFVSKHGRVYEQSVRRVIESDPLSGRVFALEKVEIVSTGSKTIRGKTVDVYSPKFVGLADIFTKRTIRAVPEVVRVDTIEDASIASLANRGKLDLQYMGKLLGKDPDVLKKEALESGSFFENPNGMNLETRDQYLSGEVKIKLAQAQAAAKLSPKYQKNVEELTKVLPADIPSNLIAIEIGAPWVPEEVFKRFFMNLLGISERTQSNFSLGYSKSGGGWVVSITNKVVANDGAKWSVSGTNYEWKDLVEDTMTMRTPNIKIGYKDSQGKFIKDEKASAEATAVAIQKQRQMRVAFQSWLAGNEETTKELAGIFNQIYNGYVLREYDGSALQFPGADMSVFKGGDFRKNQKDGVWRMLFGGNTGLGHTVGAGKTFTAIAGLMEMRRLGLKKKPCVVVPNHLTQQWAMDVLALYPAAKVLVPRDEDYDAAKRRELTARIATGDWDLVIMPQSKFKLIGVSKENKRQFMNWQIDQIQQAMADLDGEGGNANKITVKRMEKQIQKLEEKLKDILEKQEDPGTTFEETGIDYICVDEAHMYKNLFYTSKLQNVRGLGNPEGSQMAADLFMKINFLRGLSGNSGVTSFLSGTPISNSITEVYAMMRYLSPDILDHYGISTFDGWVGAFATPVSKIEREIAGTYKSKTRLSFQNVPELIRAFKAAWDIKMQKHIQLPRPEMQPGSPELVIIPQSPQQAQFAQEVRRRSEEIKARKGPPTKGEDNMLSLGTDASLGTLDYRLIDETADEDKSGKVAVATNEIIKLYKQSTKDRLTQVVFVDRQSPKTGKENPVSTTGKPRSKFDVYAAIRERLVSAGIPAREIAFIHDAETKAQKQTLFDKVNKGEIRVLIGTTEKMGAGTNIQQRLLAVHRLVPPWRPSDIEQGDGRLARPGNQINALGYKGIIKNYAIADSFDAWMFGTLAKKDKMIQQIMDGDPNIRTVEDVDEDQATVFKKWSEDTVQDPDQKRMIELQDQILNLSAQQADHARLVSASQQIVDTYPNKINQMKLELSKMQAASAENLNPEDARAKVVVKFANPSHQESYDKLSGDEANEYLQSAIDLKDMQAGITISVGNFSARKDIGKTFFEVQHKGPSGKTVYALENLYREEGDVISKLLYRFSSRGIAKAIKEMQEKVVNHEERLKTAEKDVESVFSGQAELTKLNDEVAEIERRIQAKSAASDAQIDEDSGDDDVGSEEDDDTDARITEERRGPAREEKIVRAMVENWKKGKKNLPTIEFVADHTQLPGNQKPGTDGLYDAETDTAYINLSRMVDEKTIENVLDHEILGHKATAEMMPRTDVRIAFRNLYNLAEKGIIKSPDGTKGMLASLLSRGYRQKDGETDDAFKLRMGEEAFAFMIEDKSLGDISTWSGAVKVWVNRIIAAFKRVARDLGFVELAKWGDAEIATMIADARKTIMYGDKRRPDGTPPRGGKQSRFSAALADLGAPTPGGSRRGALNMTSLMQPKKGPSAVAPAAASGQPAAKSGLRATVDRARYYLQDHLLPLLRLQEELSPEKLKDEENPYLQADVYPGAVEEMALDFEKNYWQPFMEKMQKLGVLFEDMEDYLYARHVPERNKRMQEINPKLAEAAWEGDDQGSGHTNEWAKDIMDALKKEGKMQALESVAEDFDKLNAFRRKLLISSGLQSAETIAAWDKHYQHYVPLKGLSEEARVALGLPEEGGTGTGTGQGMSVTKQERRATGRKTPATDLIANTKQMVDATIVRAGKQRVLKAFGQMLRNRAKDDERFKWIAGTNGKGDKAYLPKKPVVGKDGEVVMVPDQSAKRAENAIYWVENGEDQAVLVPRELADSMKKLDVPEIGLLQKFLGGLNRWLSMANTALNPDFLLVNLLRDVPTALISLSSEQGSKLAKQIVWSNSDVWTAGWNLAKIAMGEKTEWDEVYKKFKEEGGKTGYFSAMPTPDQLNKIKEDLEELANTAKGFSGAPWYATKKNLMKMAGALSSASEVLETATRLATFKAGLDAGMTATQAASLAKNVTVNFQRKGAWGTVLNTLFLFYNASVQGSMLPIKLAQMAYENPTGTAGKIIGGMVLLGAMIDVLGANMGGKDDDDDELYFDKVDETVKQNNLVIYSPFAKKGDRPYLFPLPYGYNFFVGLGRNISAVARGKSPMKAAGDLADTFLNSFNPLGGSSVGPEMIIPTVAKPFAQHLYANKDYLGRDLVPPEPQFGAPRAESERYYRSVSPTMRRAAKALHEVTGGDKYGSTEKNMPEFLADATDVSPEVLQHYVDWFGGGAGKTVRRILDMTYSAQRGELSQTDVNQIPIARRFVGPTDERYVQNKYRESMDDVSIAKDKANAMKKEALSMPAGDPGRQKISDAIKKLAPLARLTSQIDDVSTSRREAFRKIEALRDSGGTGNAQEAEELRNAIVKMQKVFNAGVNEVKSTGKPMGLDRRQKLAAALRALKSKTSAAGK